MNREENFVKPTAKFAAQAYYLGFVYLVFEDKQK